MTYLWKNKTEEGLENLRVLQNSQGYMKGLVVRWMPTESYRAIVFDDDIANQFFHTEDEARQYVESFFEGD